MSKTLTLEGDISAVDTLTRLTTQGSVSAPSRVTPANSKKITNVIASFSADGAAAGSAAFLLRLDGPAVMNGEQSIIIGGGGASTVQAGADSAPIAPGVFELKNADIEVSPSSVISLSTEMMGQDLGTASVVVTLVFD